MKMTKMTALLLAAAMALTACGSTAAASRRGKKQVFQFMFFLFLCVFTISSHRYGTVSPAILRGYRD